ncbi:MAG: transposase [Gelidibacter sp.]|uniref:Transposase n=1 Tax=Gelidibacter gilvus TaxID=59602 RepID=A0A4Q0XAG5_9FLAO|nr:transposase [Gelidibacter gilvus]RXJ43260.1 transposase [Gelidibacter gilvus]
MANLNGLKKGFETNYNRTFGEKFKKDTVKRIENNEYTVSEISVLYDVSKTAVYKWVYKYSILYQKGYKQIVEPMSGTHKLKELQARINELEQAVGQKQMKVDFLEKLIELAESDLGIDIKKKAGSVPKSGSGRTAKK